MSATVKLSKFSRSKIVAGLQRFLWSLNFYNSYIPAPLYELTRKRTKFVWSDLYDRAFVM